MYKMKHLIALLAFSLIISLSAVSFAEVTPEPGEAIAVIDECSNFNMVYEKSAYLKNDTINGDATITRNGTSETAADEYQYITYKLNNVQAVYLTIYYMDETNNNVLIQCSTDNTEYTDATIVKTKKTTLSGGWYSIQYAAESISEATEYIRIVLPKTGISWKPQIGRISFTQLSNFTVSAHSVTKTDDTALVSCTIQNNNMVDKSISMIVTTYDAYGMMTGIAAITKQISDTELLLEKSVSVSPSTKKIAIQFWDSFENVHRICETIYEEIEE